MNFFTKSSLYMQIYNNNEIIIIVHLFENTWYIRANTTCVRMNLLHTKLNNSAFNKSVLFSILTRHSLLYSLMHLSGGHVELGETVSINAAFTVVTWNIMFLIIRWRACIKGKCIVGLIVSGSTTCTSN